MLPILIKYTLVANAMNWGFMRTLRFFLAQYANSSTLAHWKIIGNNINRHGKYNEENRKYVYERATKMKRSRNSKKRKRQHLNIWEKGTTGFFTVSVLMQCHRTKLGCHVAFGVCCHFVDYRKLLSPIQWPSRLFFWHLDRCRCLGKFPLHPNRTGDRCRTHARLSRCPLAQLSRLELEWHQGNK